ncbi:MAG: heat-inducible transcriptional repressor HrcA [Bacillota bacterium]|nr:heat-inducible transcriptional repressor HrcA [Bacillota bacterium]
MKMNERKKKVLLAIVQDYIQTAEPVGSRTISKKYNLKVSPATIRNEMADLEEMGLIEQPHTSAGRIPSNLGYRYYVDSLMERNPLSQNQESHIQNELNQRLKQMDNVILQTSKLLSELTQYTSLVDSPKISLNSIKHVQLVPFQLQQALVLVVTESGGVVQRFMPIPEEITADDLNRISQVLNKRLQGKSVASIRKDILDDIYSELVRQKKVINAMLEIVEQALTAEAENKVYLGGTLNILNQPEFKDVEKIKQILGILDEEEVLRNLLAPTLQSGADGITIKIGTENKLAGISGCSIITATYSVEGQQVGTIGLLGPTRMDYAKAIAVIETMSKSLSKVLGAMYK